MKRREDWPLRLSAYVDGHRTTAFAWGVHDCAQFARGAIEAMTGEDPARVLDLPAYTSALGAARYLRRLPLEQIPLAVGLEPITPLKAQRGDIVLIRSAGRPVLGVCLGPLIASPGAQGTEYLPLRSAEKAWRV